MTPPLDGDGLVRVLGATALFADLDDATLARLAQVCTQRRYDRGHYLCHQGDRGDRLFVIAEGMVKVTITSFEGLEVVLATMGRNQSFGELAVLDGSPRSASVVAVEPTHVIMLHREPLMALMIRYPPVLDAMLRSLGALVRRLTEQTGDFVFLDLAGRLAKVLLRLASSHPSVDPSSHPSVDPSSHLVEHAGGEPDGSARTERTVLDLGLSQSDLAAMVGASRPAVNRALQMLAGRGWISVSGQVIVLRDLEALRRRAGL